MMVVAPTHVVIPFRVKAEFMLEVEKQLGADVSLKTWAQITHEKRLEPFLPRAFSEWIQEIRTNSASAGSLIIRRFKTLPIPAVLQNLVCEYLICLPPCLTIFPKLSMSWQPVVADDGGGDDDA
jgi:hypothetical protein